MMMGTWILLQLGAGRLQIRKDEDFLQKGFDPIGFPGLMNVALVGCNGGEGDEKYSGGEDIDNGYKEFEVENSESPLKEERLIWKIDVLKNLVDPTSLAAILKITVPVGAQQDRIIWKLNPSGCFAMKSAITSCLSPNTTNIQLNSLWQQLWKLKLHERLKVFLGRLGSNV